MSGLGGMVLQTFKTLLPDATIQEICREVGLGYAIPQPCYPLPGCFVGADGVGVRGGVGVGGSAGGSIGGGVGSSLSGSVQSVPPLVA